MTEIKILYSGCGLSGRETSLCFIASRAGIKLDPVSEPEDGWLIPWSRNNVLCNTRISKTAIRSWIAYKNFNHAIADPKTKKEMDFLKIVDGIVFLVDSQIERKQHNLELLDITRRDLAGLGRDIENIPMVFQLNKRDLINVEDVDILKKNLLWPKCLYFESIANLGVGVVEAFEGIIDLVLAGNP